MRPSLKTMIAALLGAASVQPVIGPTQTATRAPVQQHPAPTPPADRAGFDAKIEAAIARVARQHREEDLRRIAVAEGWGNGR